MIPALIITCTIFVSGGIYTALLQMQKLTLRMVNAEVELERLRRRADRHEQALSSSGSRAQ